MANTKSNPKPIGQDKDHAEIGRDLISRYMALRGVPHNMGDAPDKWQRPMLVEETPEDRQQTRDVYASMGVSLPGDIELHAPAALKGIRKAVTRGKH